MAPRLRVRLALALFTLLAAPVAVRAQNPVPVPQDSVFEYAVKFVCGRTVSPSQANPALVAPGEYFTAVNVHNPGTQTVTIRYKVAYTAAAPETVGYYTVWVGKDLKYDQALRIDCNRMGNPPPPTSPPASSPRDGFLVIRSPVDVDVVAVYTAAGQSAAGTPPTIATMDVERVQPRRMKAGGIPHATEGGQSSTP